MIVAFDCWRDRLQPLAWSIRTTACALVLLSVAACSSIQGAPPRFYPVVDEVAFVRTATGPKLYEKYIETSVLSDKKVWRDQMIYSRMYAIDIAYTRYEMDLTRELQGSGFLFTVSQLGISTAGTFVGGEQAKTILHAVETGVTGTRSAYEKNILLDRTIAVLQTQMRAERQMVKAKIITRLQRGADVYPLELALSDVEEYYRAGTITGALIQASKDAGDSLQKAQVIEGNVISTVFGETDLSQRLFDFYVATTDNSRAVERWLAGDNKQRKSYGGIAPIQFIYSSDAVNQQRMIDELHIP